MKVELDQKRLEQAIIDQAVTELIGGDNDIRDNIENEIGRRCAVERIFQN